MSGRIRENMVVVPDVYGRKRLTVSIGNCTVNNGRNTVPTKRMFDRPYAVIIMKFTIVHGSVNDVKPSPRTVVMHHLGK